MAISDRSAGLSGEQQSQPVTRGFAITPTNATDLAARTRGIWVGTGGNLNVTLAGGDTVLLKNIPNGTLLPVRADQVQSTSTTASDLVGLT